MHPQIANGNVQVLDIESSKGALTTYTAKNRQGKKVHGKALTQQHLTSWNELEAFEEEAKILSILSGKHLAHPSCVEMCRSDGQTHLLQVRALSARAASVSTLLRPEPTEQAMQDLTAVADHPA